MENRKKNVEKRKWRTESRKSVYFPSPMFYIPFSRTVNTVKQLTILLICFFIASCTSKTIYKKPDNLISKERMIDIWTDIYIARGARSVKTIDLRKNINYLPLVFKKYSIDSTQLSESNLYYTSKIDDYQKMFDEVKKRLQVEKEIYQPKKEMDSIMEMSREEIE